MGPRVCFSEVATHIVACTNGACEFEARSQVLLKALARIDK